MRAEEDAQGGGGSLAVSGWEAGILKTLDLFINKVRGSPARKFTSSSTKQKTVQKKVQRIRLEGGNESKLCFTTFL